MSLPENWIIEMLTGALGVIGIGVGKRAINKHDSLEKEVRQVKQDVDKNMLTRSEAQEHFKMIFTKIDGLGDKISYGNQSLRDHMDDAIKNHRH